ncbi:MAG: hypothetical protein EBT96_01950 [Betaproteobacteria bacterium]|nr:hypothetical protein [Betaproteobacteria bacterium]
MQRGFSLPMPSLAQETGRTGPRLPRRYRPKPHEKTPACRGFAVQVQQQALAWQTRGRVDQ